MNASSFMTYYSGRWMNQIFVRKLYRVCVEVNALNASLSG